jgi:antitoxin component HigA of HigAB toxin-antitoxin module
MHYPIEAPDPIEAIKIRMEEMHLKSLLNYLSRMLQYALIGSFSSSQYSTLKTLLGYETTERVKWCLFG